VADTTWLVDGVALRLRLPAQRAPWRVAHPVRVRKVSQLQRGCLSQPNSVDVPGRTGEERLRLVLNGVNNVTYNIAYFLAVGMLAGTSLCRVKAHI
jgi:hypothetical protein